MLPGAMNRHQLISALAERFKTFGAGDDVESLLKDNGSTFHTVYCKFNTWAYPDGVKVNTTFSIGRVRLCSSSVVEAEVLLNGNGISVLAAKVRHQLSDA
jgi:hypothetical protein